MKVISGQQFNPRQKPVKTHRKKLFLLGGLFLFLALIIYFAFFAGLFDVRSVEIKAPKKVTVSEVESQLNSWLNGGYLGINRRNNYFLFNPRKMTANILNQFIIADSVAIKRNGHRLEVEVSVRKPVGIWCLKKNSACYFFDEKGIAYENAGQAEGFIYAVITDYRERGLELGQEVEAKNWRDLIFLTRGLLKRNGFEAAEFVIPSGTQDEFEVKTFNSDVLGQKSFLIKISGETELENQIAAFADLYKKKLTPDERSQLEYADLRIPGRVYYK